ncbi:hypothetical protein [Moheibacter sediminis]|uniref:TonB protein C-terminal n=1 Tax=Moheibacter sediminis TaxID=1434700 RepID=A0A1W2AAI1_9FLAO|nr:hypothetical protein [Moheibacter sediminis]SMC57492.1 hypothetical protein SAMN06296427_10456 [Moheibacter sediminis]
MGPIAILLIFLLSISSLAQERYFEDSSFSMLAGGQSKYKRVYNIENDHVNIEDYVGSYRVHKGQVYGLNDVKQIDSYISYCVSLNNINADRDYSKNAQGIFRINSNKGNKLRQVYVKGNSIRTGQVWDEEGNEKLINGTGILNIDSRDEISTTIYKDSMLLNAYIVRKEKRDTIFQVFQKRAEPIGGLKNYYQKIYDKVGFPKNGKPGETISFSIKVKLIVNEDGELSDLSAEAFSVKLLKSYPKNGIPIHPEPLADPQYDYMGEKIIKEMKKLPKWNPAEKDNKPVRTESILTFGFHVST